MRSIIRVKPFSFNIENYEKWLEKKAEEGLILTKKVKFIHIFKKGKSEKVKYFVDINDFVVDLCNNNKNLSKPRINKEILDYEELYKDCGWELIYKKDNDCLVRLNYLDIHLWKKPYTDEKPTALTDFNSLIKLYKHAIYTNILLPLLFPEITLLILSFAKTESSYHGLFWFYGEILSLNTDPLPKLITIALIIYCLICLMRYYIKYRMLKREAIYKG